MDWRHGLGGRAPVLQVGSPEFKPQSKPKKKEKVFIFSFLGRKTS
jgi:hypothetical protein